VTLQFYLWHNKKPPPYGMTVGKKLRRCFRVFNEPILNMRTALTVAAYIDDTQLLLRRQESNLHHILTSRGGKKRMLYPLSYAAYLKRPSNDGLFLFFKDFSPTKALLIIYNSSNYFSLFIVNYTSEAGTYFARIHYNPFFQVRIFSKLLINF
jgi:hypothetical protein